MEEKVKKNIKKDLPMGKKPRLKKKKMGRPKKRGPKKKHKYSYIPKKKKIDGRTCSKYKRTIDYKIVTSHNGKQKDYIGKYRTLEEAYIDFNELIKKNDSVFIPKEVRNDGQIHYIKDEYLLLEKNRFGDKEGAYLRNEYGKLIKQETTSKTWVVLDTHIMLTEETFWVWGYDAKTDRKTFPWVYSEIICDGIETKYDIKRIIQYKNKIVIKNDSLDCDIVFCKNRGDAIRFYNKLREVVTEDKRTKNILFCGSYDELSEKRHELEQLLSDITGFTIRKLQNDTTKKCRQYKK